jgi:hypothetical protein
VGIQLPVPSSHTLSVGLRRIVDQYVKGFGHLVQAKSPYRVLRFDFHPAVRFETETFRSLTFGDADELPPRAARVDQSFPTPGLADEH